jgi:cytochrome P450 family 6
LFSISLVSSIRTHIDHLPSNDSPGFDSSSTTLAFCLHSLAFDLKVQHEARESVEAVLRKYNGEWCYEAVSEMTYIDQIIDETLRLFPPVTTIHRIVTKDYQLPNGEVLKEGKLVIIPNLAFQRDPEIFPDPMKFDPERFSDEAKASRHSFSSLPFGEGKN